jgi:hypothetical protein
MFDSKLLIHGTNTIAGIVDEIQLAGTLISLQRISTVPVEKQFGKARTHAGVHQAAVELIRTTKDDEAMPFIYVQGQVKNRRLAYGETTSSCTCLTGIGITPLNCAEAVIHIVEFPATISPLLAETTRDEFYIFAEKLMSNALVPCQDQFQYGECSKAALTISRTRRGPPSSRRIILSSKSEMRRVIGQTAVDRIEQHLGALLRQPRVLSEKLKLLVV